MAATSKGDREGHVQPQLLQGHSEIPCPPGDEEWLHKVWAQRTAEKEEKEGDRDGEREAGSVGVRKERKKIISGKL